MMRTTQHENALIDPRQIKVQDVLLHFQPSSPAMLPVVQVLQDSCLELVVAISTMMQNVEEAKERLSVAPPSHSSTQEKELWDFVRKVSGQTFCSAVDLYQLLCELIRKLRGIQGSSASAGELIHNGAEFSFATPNFFKAIKEFGDFQIAYNQKCTSFLQQVNDNLREVAFRIQGHHNFEVALNSVEKLQADYMRNMNAVIKIENEWMPKFIAFDQQMMDLNSKLFLVKDSLANTERALDNARNRTQTAIDEMTAARQKWLNTPESITENRSYTTTQRGWFSRRTTTYHYTVSVSNPEKARSESLFREAKSFQDFLGSLEGDTEQKRATLEKERLRWDQEKHALETKQRQVINDYEKIHNDALVKMEDSKKALDGAKKTVDDMLKLVGISVPEVCLKFVKSLSNLPDDIMEQGIRAIGMNTTLATFDDWLKTEFLTTQEHPTIMDTCKTLGIGEANLQFFDGAFKQLGLVNLKEIEGVTEPDMFSFFDEIEVRLTAVQKFALKKLIKSCDPEVAEKNTRIRQEMQAGLITEFAQYLGILVPSTQTALSLSINSKSTPTNLICP